MTDSAERRWWPHKRTAETLANAVWAAGPPLLFGLRMWASVSLALYVAFRLELADPYWAGTSASIVCQPQVGASLRKGWFRMIGTLVGAVAIVVLTACCPQNRPLFLGGLALWGAACAFVATLLRNFAAYAAALAGYTAAIIAGDELGATGGVNGQAFMLAITRASEICIGIACAGVILACTDLGGAPRRLAALFASLCAEIMGRFVGALTKAGLEFHDTRPVRREFVRRIIALDPVIDQSLGESSRLRTHSPILQSAVDGLFEALTGWRAVADHLARLPRVEAQQAAGIILQTLPKELRPPSDSDDPGLGSAENLARWMRAPAGLHRNCEAAARRLIALPAATPSLRLLADQTAKLLTGMTQALNALALLVADPARPLPEHGAVRLRVADWLPAFINAGRAFVTISGIALFWVVTAWPSGALAITWATIMVILLAPRADQAYAATMRFMVGTLLAALFAAVIAFAAPPSLPNQTFGALSIILGLYFVPAGALMAQPWLNAVFTAMTVNFVPLLGPANPMNYNQAQFYNQATAIVVGVGAAALSFRLLPPLSPATCTHRLLALTLHDLRRVAAGCTRKDWEGHVHGRLSALPDVATPLQRAQLLAALAVGSEIIWLRQSARRHEFEGGLEPALAAVARGDTSAAIECLAHLDAALAAGAAAGPRTEAMLRVRAGLLAMSEALTQHAPFFDAGAAR